MGGAERVVHVYVDQRGQRRCQLGVVLRLARLVAHVFEHQHVSGPEAVDEPPDLLPDHRRG